MEGSNDPLTHNIRGQTNVYDVHTVVNACQHGKTSVVEDALRQGTSADTVDDDGCSLLHWAAINNKIEIIRLLIEHNADANRLGGVLVSSPLHWSARNGHVAACALLVKAGAVCNVRDVQGYTPMHLAIQGSHVPLVAYFLLKFDYAKDFTDNSGMTPAMWCAYRSFTMFPLRLIITSHADLTLKEHLQGNTALHIAVHERNLSAVLELLKGGASVDVRNKQQETPLDMAKMNKNPTILDAMEDAARRQGVVRSNCYRKLFVPPISTYLLFLLPSFIMICCWQLFSNVQFMFSVIILLIASVLSMITFRVDFNTPNNRLLPYGVTISEACLMIISWASYAHWYVPWWAQLLFVISIVLLAFTLFRIATVDPGIVKPLKNCHQMYVDEAEFGIQFQEKYCFTCFVKKMENTKHCAVCNYCVAKFDHHCPWINSCVTRRNMREFILFILSVMLSSGIYCLATGHYALIEIGEHGIENFLEQKAFLFITIFLSAMHAVMLFGLLIVQINQISINVTTNERIKTRRMYGHHGDHSMINQPVSLTTRCQNLLEFCSSNDDAV